MIRKICVRVNLAIKENFIIGCDSFDDRILTLHIKGKYIVWLGSCHISLGHIGKAI
jgi:hypothetical protein